MSTMPTHRKKLIEVALPLDAINKEAAREKSIRHGHPSTLHLWWARRPLAACRAVLFSSLVNDPGDDPMYGIDEGTAATERASLFDLIEDLVKWENSNNPAVVNRARLEIARSIAANKVADGELEDHTPLVANAPQLPDEQTKYLPDPPPEYTPHEVRFKVPGLKPEQVNHFLAHYAPPVLDPFAGGGSIPLEAQRLGLRAYASDLNPVPVLINKALIEIPPKFANMPPVNPNARKGRLKSKEWHGAEGLAEDVRYYGKWMRDEAEKRIGHLYPKVKISDEMAADRPDLLPYIGQELPVIAWLWARTVKSPNPATGNAEVPLVRSFWLSKKPGKMAYVKPQIDAKTNSYTFRVYSGEPTDGFNPDDATIISRQGGRCILSGTPMPFQYIRDAGKEDGLGERLLAIVCEGERERIFLAPTVKYVEVAYSEKPRWRPDAEMPLKHRNFQPPVYGMNNLGDLFTDRQLVSLTTFSDLVAEVRKQVLEDAESANFADDAKAYADGIATLLAFSVNKSAEGSTTLCSWSPLPTKLHVVSTFGRQALPMVWDFAESNPFANSSGNIERMSKLVAEVIDRLFVSASSIGIARQQDAVKLDSSAGSPVISTDPPYYDNIEYADLSDFFYVWFRRSLGLIYPELFETLLTPKSNELVASPHRHSGDRNAAKAFFETGLGEAIAAMRREGRADFPLTIYYAFKQTETEDENTVASTGWETMLSGVINAGFSITGTWPMRTERSGGFRNNNQNALASSIILACVPRSSDALMVTRRDFATALRKELPEAIKHLQSGNVAPVDLAQASIGPGMAVFSRYIKVVNADGSPMSVREALQLINQVLDEALIEQECDFDAETRFALRWFEQYGMQEGPFGDAETLAKAMAVSVNGVAEAGIVKSRAGKVKLLKREELKSDWDPRSDSRLTMWEVAQHLIRSLEHDGESAAGELLQRVGTSNGEIARELAYRLYQTCERKKLPEDARSYNGLVVSWPEIVKLSQQKPRQEGQTVLF